jgi:hypothetical protein
MTDARDEVIAALVEALRPFVRAMPSRDAPCHFGICSQSLCGHCSRIAAGQAAIARAKYLTVREPA